MHLWVKNFVKRAEIHKYLEMKRLDPIIMILKPDIKYKELTVHYSKIGEKQLWVDSGITIQALQNLF